MSGIYDFQPNHLLEFELDYELKIRVASSPRNVAEKRKILGRLLRKEKPDADINLVIVTLDIAVERREIQSSLDSVARVVDEFDGTSADSAFRRVMSRLNHVRGRASRIPKPGDEAGRANLFSFVQEVNASTYKIEADLFDKVDPNQLPVPPIQSTNPVINVAAPIVHCASRSLPVSEWGVNFDGNSKELYPFLERLLELAQARNVSKVDLFKSAAEFFIDDAFVWYRSVKSSVTDWDSLVVRLRKDFLHDDIEDELWEQIKKRKQKRNESTIVFIAHLETLFSRLSRTPPEVSKVKHIRQGLLPEFISRLALENITSVAQLSDLCRKLEEAEYIRNKSENRTKFVSKSEISEVHSGTESKPGPSGYRSQQKQKQFKKPFNKSYEDKSPKVNNVNVESNFNAKPKAKELVCWNCKLQNHSFLNCKAPRSLFCYKCGEPNCKVSSCPKCAKN